MSAIDTLYWLQFQFEWGQLSLTMQWSLMWSKVIMVQSTIYVGHLPPLYNVERFISKSACNKNLPTAISVRHHACTNWSSTRPIHWYSLWCFIMFYSVSIHKTVKRTKISTRVLPLELGILLGTVASAASVGKKNNQYLLEVGSQ